MRRSIRISVAVAVVLALLCGVYAAVWVTVADRLRESVVAWAQAQRAHKMSVSWRHLRVNGFPLAFRLEFDTAALSDGALSPAPELRVATLTAMVRPWNFDVWHLAAPSGATVTLGAAGGRPALRLAARQVAGAVAVDDGGGTTIWLVADDTTADAGGTVSIKSADWWVVVPGQPAQSHTDPDFSVAASLHQITLPKPVPPLGNAIAEAAFAAVAKGPIPDGPLPKAASAWRDAGGTVELTGFHLAAGALVANGSGTLALDGDLQPIGGFSGSVQGYDQIMAALVAGGQMPARDAGLARLGLAMLAKAGPDGRPEIRTSFTIQNGEMFLGPAKLGKVPRIQW